MPVAVDGQAGARGGAGGVVNGAVPVVVVALFGGGVIARLFEVLEHVGGVGAGSLVVRRGCMV